MKSKLFLVSLVAILSIALLGFASASTLNVINQVVEIDGLAATGNVAVVAGDNLPITVDFTANTNASEVVVSAWIQGYRADRVEENFADLIKGSDYRARLSVPVPDIDPEEELTLYVRIETDNGNWEESYTLHGQRQSNALDVLLVDMDSTVKAGMTLPVGVVVKNIGRHESENTMVSVKIPELGISKTAYLDDLYVVDSCSSDTCDQDDAAERKILISVPSNAQAGTYKVEINAFNDKTDATVIKTLTISEKDVEGRVLANPSTKSFAAGEQAVYDLILVNSGDKMEVYNLAPTVSDALAITLSDSVAAVPAGSSKTVKVYVTANREGTYGFAVNVNSDAGFADKVTYTAMIKQAQALTNNNLIVLTVALAIIFIVLIIVLVVLLTKPQKTEEFGESYY